MCVCVCVCVVCVCVCVCVCLVGDGSHVSRMKPAYVIQWDSSWRGGGGGGCGGVTVVRWMPLPVTAGAYFQDS